VTTGTVRTGAQRLAAEPGLVKGSRIGLVTNATGVLPDLSPNVRAFRSAGIPLAALFGPEHGVSGAAQAGHGESAAVDAASGLPVYDTHLRSGPALDRLVQLSHVDTLVYDLADVGSRFYTYVWTMHDVMESAARLGLPFVVLDRPNPLGGTHSEGPVLQPPFASFVGRGEIPVRHGLTIAELAGRLNRGIGADLRVVAMEGWWRDAWFDETGLPWVMPSVNMPTLDTAVVYPGTALFEGTSLSEGRGTTRPFELIGAPFVDGQWAEALNALELPGVRFRQVSFAPTFHKYAGERVHGVQVHVTDREAFRPVRTGVAMLHCARRLYPDGFAWVPPDSGAGSTGHRYFIDLLWGSDSLRRCLDGGGDPAGLVAEPVHPSAWAGEDALRYPGRDGREGPTGRRTSAW
jgi:uncharacterized protein YbbC (DUF1343 family)